MDFTLTDEQELLRDTARGLLGNECPISLVRAHIEDPSVADALWRHQLSGWVAVGEESLVDLCLFLEEMGAAVAPGPYFATTALFLPLLQTIGHELVPQVVAGEVTGTVALAGRDGLWVANSDSVRTFVPEADRVDKVAIVGNDPFADDGSCTVTIVDSSTLVARHVETLDSTRRVFEIDVAAALAGGSIDEHTALASDRLEAVIERATVALAAEMMGSVRWLVQATVAYAKERIQFDKPIGSFQGLQYKMVDMSLDYERALAAVYYAAMAIDAGDPDRHRAAHVAKGAAGAAVKHCAKDAMQIHGGIGYTWEHDLHLYLRRGYASEYLLGPSQWHHDRLADLLFT